MPTCEKCGSFVEDNIRVCPFCNSKIDFDSNLPVQTDSLPDEAVDEIIILKTDKNLEADTSLDNLLIVHTPDIEEIVQEEHKEKGISKQLDIIPERKYILWFLLGIATVGIGFLVYLFINLEDLDRHSEYPNDARAQPIQVDASRILIIFLLAIFFGFIPILWWIYYKKYASLYYHIREQKHDMAPFKLPHPAIYLIPLILSHILAIVPTLVGFIIKENLKDVIPWLFWLLMGLVTVISLGTSLIDYYWQRALNAHVKMTMARLSIRQEAEKVTKRT